MGEANFLQVLIAPEYWEALKKSEVLALNGKGHRGNTFASLRE